MSGLILGTVAYGMHASATAALLVLDSVPQKLSNITVVAWGSGLFSLLRRNSVGLAGSSSHTLMRLRSMYKRYKPTFAHEWACAYGMKVQGRHCRLVAHDREACMMRAA